VDSFGYNDLDTDMSAEGKTTAGKYRPWADPNLPFLGALFLCLYAAYYASVNLPVGKSRSLYIILALIVIAALLVLRYVRIGWWQNNLRHLSYILLALASVYVVLFNTSADGLQSPIIYFGIIFFLLISWLYLT
jgi:hypothetical protein